MEEREQASNEYRSIEEVRWDPMHWDGRGTYLTHWLLSDPAILAIWICCVSNSRLAVTLGIRDVYVSTPQSFLHVCATHAHSYDGTPVLVLVDCIFGVPTVEQDLLGIHGTGVRRLGKHCQISSDDH